MSIDDEQEEHRHFSKIVAAFEHYGTYSVTIRVRLLGVLV